MTVDAWIYLSGGILLVAQIVGRRISVEPAWFLWSVAVGCLIAAYFAAR